MTEEEYNKRVASILEKQTAKECHKFMAESGKQSKFKNIKTESVGLTFDSKREAARWNTLLMLELAGEITNLRRQVKFELLPKQKGLTRVERGCSYVADFVYTQDKREVVEDCKGMRTPIYILKRKLLLWTHNIEVLET
jgi:hypothetical protein